MSSRGCISHREWVISHTSAAHRPMLTPLRAVLSFHCTATETVAIDAVDFLASSKVDAEVSYTGPQFEELDPELQEAFHEFLADAGVDDSVGSYVALYADFKEQQEYTNCLTKVHDFTK